MKRLFVVGIVLLFVAAGACKKAKGPANGKSVQPNNNLDSNVLMTAVINAVKWRSDSAFGYLVKTSGNDSGRANLMITATQKSTNNPTTITLIINNFTGPNTYSINPPVNTATYYIGNNRHYAILGKVIITSDTAYALKGTFNFVADTISVTNGVFNVARP